MSSNFTVTAQLRTDMGKGASRRLRHANKVPAIVYGGDKEPTLITLAHNEMIHSLDDEAFFSHILSLNLDGKTEQVILKDLQRHPAKELIMHVDFQRIVAGTALHVNVPLHFINENVAPGVKQGGNVSHLKTELEISCLPQDLPEYIEVDIASLDVGESLHLSDIVLPTGVTILELAQGEVHDSPVVSIVMPRGEKTDTETEEAETDEEA